MLSCSIPFSKTMQFNQGRLGVFKDPFTVLLAPFTASNQVNKISVLQEGPNFLSFSSPKIYQKCGQGVIRPSFFTAQILVFKQREENTLQRSNKQSRRALFKIEYTFFNKDKAPTSWVLNIAAFGLLGLENSKELPSIK